MPIANYGKPKTTKIMNSKNSETNRPCWFVGAAYSSGTEDQTSRFIKEGIWENGWPDKHIDTVKSVEPGDRIAIKSSYTRKKNLPFDNRGHTVAVMAIKAIGTVKENPGDGRILKVDWEPMNAPRKWYFMTNMGTIWQVSSGENWRKDALIGFAFHNKPQDIERFRGELPWREKFGDAKSGEIKFAWTSFYEAVADKLFKFKDRRDELVKGIHEIVDQMDGLSSYRDKFKDGTDGPLRDICPFTTLGIFNQNQKLDNRKRIAAELRRFLGVSEPVPHSFNENNNDRSQQRLTLEGVPTLLPKNRYLFAYEKERKSDDIEVLWEIFYQAIRLAESNNTDNRFAFAKAYNKAIQIKNVSWNLTIGLYWIRPWTFQTLDSKSREYISKELGIKIPKDRPNAENYLHILDTLETLFQEDACPVHSFPELSREAWLYESDTPAPTPIPPNPPEPEPAPRPEKTYYSMDELATECFFDRSRLEKILERLKTKKNLILQGPPGTGKTWLAKRLAYVLIGQRDRDRIRALQFHPNLSYEDFVRGWRPAGEGKLELVDGPFLKMVETAKEEPDEIHVIVIEEINRGNPAQIFGELLTLLEADKRNPDEALELCYPKDEGERVFIPENLYVIGTMNIADRSLALVDLALRRRFALVDLEPTFGDSWSKWVHGNFSINHDILSEIENRIRTLNDVIKNDKSLGPQFRVGHSYVTPTTHIADPRNWFQQVVNTEIGPLLEEYWFDNLEEAEKNKKLLLEGF